ncbi:hypothetical protein ncot_15885 [Nocardioides sp. JQ2195]|uniref:hypothetical protein n=1 Tax=Nocardioides sp. JQ2195 TaxID=2592334 RepID=UPI00143EC03D|nr:hypothetical protein [Nocardioides sp. JQ2195]QIX27900.1 hypothetical protein ncot_15885 [Nocardioides sp. JQ2195]
MKRVIHLLGVVVGIGCGLLLGLTIGAGHAETRAPDGWEPPPGTIVEVLGNPENGFSIHHYDGSWLHPPTDSEAAAECSAQDRRVRRVRCTTRVRVWYRDLGRLRRALRYAHHVGGDD